MDSALCPSFQCVESALIIGVQERGKTSFLPRAITVDSQFVDMTREEPLFDRFRFAGHCSRQGCSHFRLGACGLIKKQLKKFNPVIKVSDLPKCSIRKNCQWYGENGFYACSLCAGITEKRKLRSEEPAVTFYFHRLA
ncbi:MAG TPA: hypothetical protein VLC28_00455 [Flavitalea sp.]|nr:hypothetical protein [Flavitalea sp.]